MPRRFVALILVLVSACVPGAGIAPERDSIGSTVSAKEVVAKRAPELLVARDASTCPVSPDRFAATKVGQLVRCAWRPA